MSNEKNHDNGLSLLIKNWDHSISALEDLLEDSNFVKFIRKRIRKNLQ